LPGPPAGNGTGDERRIDPTPAGDPSGTAVARLLERFDPSVFDIGRPLVRLRTPLGRAAFYAAARNIYLEEPRGPGGLWTRLGSLQADALFVCGAMDDLVPIGFARHVRSELPTARHLELDCGHVPQLERPRETHEAMTRFIATGRLGG
jgi:pimeloyl-ACP methyl ester carboxylesterase